MDPLCIVRAAKPNKYDQAPKNSICKVVKALSNEYDIYRQLSSDNDNPIWEIELEVRNGE